MALSIWQAAEVITQSSHSNLVRAHGSLLATATASGAISEGRLSVLAPLLKHPVPELS